MKRKTVKGKFSVFILLVLIIFSLTACISNTNILKPRSFDLSDIDGCEEKREKLSDYDNSYKKFASSLTDETTKFGTRFFACEISCQGKKFLSQLPKELDCKQHCMDQCSKQVDTDIIAAKLSHSLSKSFNQQTEDLVKIRDEINSLQICRDMEAKDILIDLKQEDTAKRELALQRYEKLKIRIEKDNELIERLLGNTDTVIKENKETGIEAGLIRNQEIVDCSKSVRIRDGYKIRKGPGTEFNPPLGVSNNTTVKLCEIKGDWVRILHHETLAYVHIDALSQGTQTTASSNANGVEGALADVEAEQSEAEESHQEYTRVMDDNIREIEEAIS